VKKFLILTKFAWFCSMPSGRSPPSFSIFFLEKKKFFFMLQYNQGTRSHQTTSSLGCLTFWLRRASARTWFRYSWKITISDSASLLIHPTSWCCVVVDLLHHPLCRRLPKAGRSLLGGKHLQQGQECVEEGIEGSGEHLHSARSRCVPDFGGSGSWQIEGCALSIRRWL